jgi:hypothetical protein
LMVGVHTHVWITSLDNQRAVLAVTFKNEAYYMQSNAHTC